MQRAQDHHAVTEEVKKIQILFVSTEFVTVFPADIEKIKKYFQIGFDFFLLLSFFLFSLLQDFVLCRTSMKFRHSQSKQCSVLEIFSYENSN